MDFNLTREELRAYAAMYWSYAERAKREGNIDLAKQFEEIAREADAELAQAA